MSRPEKTPPDYMTFLKKIIRKGCFFGLRALSHIGITPFKSRSPFVRIDKRYFDEQWYAERYPDVAAANLSPFEHYCAFGYLEGREARIFDEFWYLRTYPDAAFHRGGGLAHYLEFGSEEGRSARYLLLSAGTAQSDRNNYAKWLVENETILRAQEKNLSQLTGGPLISILVAVFNPKREHLVECLESVLAQTYLNWELCIADDASTSAHVAEVLETYAAKDSRIKIKFRSENGHISAASNSALELAKGELVALLDHDDVLSPDALTWVASYALSYPDANIIYSDEDKIDDTGRRFDPYFKSDFNYELFLAQNMISHLGVYRRSKLNEIGGFRIGVEGAQDHDLALRVVELSEPRQIVHIPRVLYHWRATPGSTALSVEQKLYAPKAGLKAVAQHLERMKINAIVQPAPANLSHYRVRYALPTPEPLVTIIIPTRDHSLLLFKCIESIKRNTIYKNYEIIIVDNGSEEKETFEIFERIRSEKIRILNFDQPFNFSAINNFAVENASGDYVCLMNNDIEVVSPDWLGEMLGFASQPGVGCVGARLWYPDGTLQHGGVVLGIGGVAGHAFKYSPRPNVGYFSRAIHHQSYSAVTAACLLIDKKIYRAVGGLDEKLAVAFNDIDFCLRVRSAGYRNVWTPYAELIHHESISRGHEITPEKRRRFSSEIDFMIARWGDALLSDPAYNPNLTLEHEDFSLAWPPRSVGRGRSSEEWTRVSESASK